MNKKALVFILAVSMLVLAIVPATAQDDLVFAIGEGDFSWGDLDAFMEMDFSGQELEFSTPWTLADNDLVESLLAYFEYATGVTIVHVGSDSFEQQILIDIESGNPPNIAVFPQPGLAADAAKNGGLIPLGDDVYNAVVENYAAGEGWAGMGTYADENGEEQFFALPFKLDLKSLVWYVPENFADAGYEIPTTMEELIALSDQIVADGGTPWCIGLGSQENTGWPGTDWVEDLMLRTAPPEVYDQWVTNEIPFNDPRVINAIEQFGVFALNDDYVAGGSASVATTDFRDSPAGLFTVPPDCYMHRMASFIPSFFPKDTEALVDWNFFYFPAFASEDLGNPVLAAGTFWTITKDSEPARAFFDFLMTPLANEIWMAQSGFLSAHKGADPAIYSNDINRQMGEILLNADIVRFDGSDLMPGRIGAGAFWTAMVDYVSGNKSAEEVANDVQAAWDAIKEE
jgi:alpha-glucoside transport system substrate-binding protein